MTDRLNETKRGIVRELLAKLDLLPFEEVAIEYYVEELRATLPHLTQQAEEIFERVTPLLEISPYYYDFDPEVMQREKMEAFTQFKKSTNASLRSILIDMEVSEKLKPTDAVAERSSDTTISNKKVFIVHGHDEHLKSEVARFVGKAGLEAIILSEQPSGGTTIIENFESHSDVRFAIILYTPCDVGNSVSEDTPRQRARQNVVFEHGYFIGKLGRDSVAVIYKDQVELPSDILGLIYHKFDSADNISWQVKLAREMKNVGMDVDLNSLF